MVSCEQTVYWVYFEVEQFWNQYFYHYCSVLSKNILQNIAHSFLQMLLTYGFLAVCLFLLYFLIADLFDSLQGSRCAVSTGCTSSRLGWLPRSWRTPPRLPSGGSIEGDPPFPQADVRGPFLSVHHTELLHNRGISQVHHGKWSLLTNNTNDTYAEYCHLVAMLTASARPHWV